MPDAEQETFTAHPMPGWVAIVEIPQGTVQEGSVKTEDVSLPGFGVLRAIKGVEPGISSAIVLECGFNPYTWDLPFGDGDTVFYQENSGFSIGDRSFIPMNQILCWKGGY